MRYTDNVQCHRVVDVTEPKWFQLLRAGHKIDAIKELRAFIANKQPINYEADTPPAEIETDHARYRLSLLQAKLIVESFEVEVSYYPQD